jgi:hypothetical protein
MVKIYLSYGKEEAPAGFDKFHPEAEGLLNVTPSENARKPNSRQSTLT